MSPSSDAFRPETLVAVKAVQEALDLARSGVGSDRVTFKGSRDIVTATDVAVEDAIRGRVSDVGFPVVGEERGGQAPLDGSPYWLVDPICGTRNFASGIPLYCVNLALVEGDRVTASVVGVPSAEIDVAERGGGAWAITGATRRRLTVGDASRIVVIEDGRATGARREQAAEFTARAIRTDGWELRALSTTLALPHVAAGRIAAYVLFWASALHTGAGSLLASEAGATVSDIDGQPWTIRSDSIVASANPRLHRELLAHRNERPGPWRPSG